MCSIRVVIILEMFVLFFTIDTKSHVFHEKMQSNQLSYNQTKRLYQAEEAYLYTRFII